MTETYFTKRLKSIQQTFARLTERLADPYLTKDSDELLKIYKARKSLAEIIELDRQLQQTKEELASVRQIVDDLDEDPELQELAIAEIADLETKISQLTEQLNILLLPQDPLDERGVFLEIIADPNQEESSIWVGDLVRMYARYGESQNWQVLLVSEDLGEWEGFKQVILALEGDKIYGKLKLETGIHQLESNFPRIKNSRTSATVNVLPQVDSAEMPIPPQEIKIYDRRSTNCRCNACVCKTEVGVQVLHQPTGIRVTCIEERSQLQNRDRAMEILRVKLHYLKLAANKELEIIRTYSDRDNLISDRRLSQKFPLATAMEGDIEEMIQSCIFQDRQQRWLKLANSLDTAETLN